MTTFPDGTLRRSNRCRHRRRNRDGAKFAVKGFTEALINDLRLNAPHVKASVVMPGHIGTSIVINSGKFLGREPKELTSEQLADVRRRLAQRGMDVSAPSDDDLRVGMQMQAEMFRDAAPPPRRRLRPSSSMVSAPGAGGSWWATMPSGWTSWSASSRPTPTTIRSCRCCEREPVLLRHRTGTGRLTSGNSSCVG